MPVVVTSTTFVFFNSCTKKPSTVVLLPKGNCFTSVNPFRSIYYKKNANEFHPHRAQHMEGCSVTMTTERSARDTNNTKLVNNNNTCTAQLGSIPVLAFTSALVQISQRTEQLTADRISRSFVRIRIQSGELHSNKHELHTG